MENQITDGNPIRDYDSEDFHLHTVIPTDKNPVVISSGAECRLTKPVDVMEGGRGQIEVFPRNVAKTGADNSLEVEDNAAGLLGTSPVNRGMISHAEDVPTHYTKSDAYFGVPKNDDASAKSYVDFLNADRKKLLPETIKNHDEILKHIGIDCKSHGLEVAPVFSTDDIRAITKQAVAPNADKSPGR